MSCKLTAMAALAAASTSVFAMDTTITDTTGYVTFKNGDGNGFTSFASGSNWSDGGVPQNGVNDYLVQGGLTLRTPTTENGDNTFGGASLTIDNGNLYLKGRGSPKLRVADLRLYGSRIVQADANSTHAIYGTMTVYGNAAGKRTQFEVTCNGGTRNIALRNTVVGSGDSVITLTKTTDAEESGTPRLIVSDAADMSGFHGRYEVIGAGRSSGMYVSLQTPTIAALGNPNLPEGTPYITFSSYGGLYATNCLEIVGQSFAVGNGGALLSAWPSPTNPTGTLFADSQIARMNNYSMYVGRGTTITGVGDGTGEDDRVLSVDSGDNGGAIVLDDVTLNNIAALRFSYYYGRIYPNYDNPDVPIIVDGARSPAANRAQLTIISSTTAPKVGPVTLRAAGRLSLGHDFRSNANEAVELTIPALAVEDGECAIITKKFSETTADLLHVTGNVTKASGVEKIRFCMANTGAAQFTNVQDHVRLLTAANLSAVAGEGLVTADDFEVYSTDQTVNRNLQLCATLSVVEDSGRNYLVCSNAYPIVKETKQETDADNGFSKAGGWDNGEAPSSGNDYVVPQGKVLRASSAATFKGHSLTIESGGDLAIKGVAATVNDFRMNGGGKITVRSDGTGNKLFGNGTLVCGDITNPANAFLIEIETDQDVRMFEFGVNLSGGGLVAPRWYSGKTSHLDPTNRVTISGDNGAYTGSWFLTTPDVRTVFANSGSIGDIGSPMINKIQFKYGGRLYVPEDLTIPSELGMQVRWDADKSKSIGIIEVAPGKTLTVASALHGDGKFQKDGEGDLVLASATTDFHGNDSKVRLGRGRVILRNAAALDAAGGQIEVDSSLPQGVGNCLRIECAGPVAVKNGGLTWTGEKVPLRLEAGAFDAEGFAGGEVPLLLFKSAGVGDFVPGTDVVLVNRRKGYTCELLSRAEGSDLLFYAKATRLGFLVFVR